MSLGCRFELMVPISSTWMHCAGPDVTPSFTNIPAVRNPSYPSISMKNMHLGPA
jgi:hypothetical protein